MKSSVSKKLLLWFILTLCVSLGGFLATTWILAADAPDPGGLMASILVLQLEGAVAAYEAGGTAALAKHISRLDELFPATHALLDVTGRDLLTGEDRSEEVKRAQVRPVRPPPPTFPLLLERSTPDGKYRLLVAGAARFDPIAYLPFYLWIVGLVVLMWYGFSRHLTTPLRQLREAVARFGAGERNVRIPAGREDEFGQLAREFNDMAERIDVLLKAERRLFEDISHELRSPLARLILTIELARTSEDHVAGLARVKKEASRIADLIRELLEISRAQGDRAAREFKPVDLNGLLGFLIESCSIEAEAKNCSIQRTGTETARVKGDAELLRRAVENVLRNAIRHAPYDSEISVSLHSGPAGSVIRIRDRGPGVPDEMVGDIFKPFFRLERDRSRDSGGTGLGLAIAQRAVQLHRGVIVAHNADPGLEVEINLPS